jgi:hypothetical protein
VHWAHTHEDREGLLGDVGVCSEARIIIGEGWSMGGRVVGAAVGADVGLPGGVVGNHRWGWERWGVKTEEGIVFEKAESMWG